MASASTKVATTKSILAPSMTLKGHGDWIRTVSYFPDGQRMISGSYDCTARQWDLKEGKEIEEVRDVCKEEEVFAVAVSRDSRWVVTGGDSAELKVCEVETGIVKNLEGDSISCIDISADNTVLLASGSWNATMRIWNLETGKLVAGPFKCEDSVGAVRFSTDSKKLAVESCTGKKRFGRGNSPSQHRLTSAFPKREQARAVLEERETRDHQAPSRTNEWPETLDTGERRRATTTGAC